MIDIDYSFIRLRETLEDACNMQEPPLASENYTGQVHLLPNDSEPYLQITNSPTPIIIEDFSAFLVDSVTNQEYDITENVFVFPFIDINGVAQVAFEIIAIPYDFGGNPCYLRFDSGQSYYSNLFLCTILYSNQTTRFDYWNTDVYWGTDYFTSNMRQSIRLNTYFDNFVSQDELPTYFRITTNQTINQRAKISDFYKYIFPQLNAWTAKRLKRILYGNYLYMNEIRSYVVKGFEMPEREADSNVGIAEFVINQDEGDIYEVIPQIYNGLFYILSPINGSTFTVVEAADLDFIDVIFNQDVTLNTISGIIENITTTDAWAIDNTNSNITEGNTLRIDTSGIFDSDLGVYEIVINAGAVTGSLMGELSPAITGWQIIVSGGSFDNSFDASFDIE
jgi:hypothetical protein